MISDGNYSATSLKS